ncbi:MAG: glycosyltransferase family 39 protein, partial [Candidatus Latescibacterota bacterium]
MAKRTTKKTSLTARIGDWYVYVILFVVSVLVRIPFLDAFDLVSYDGTYYINQAKGFLGSPHLSGGFPIGYPVFIAALLPIVGDGVRAAQIISFMAGIGSLFVFYALGKRLVSRRLVVVAVLVLAVTPLFVRLSLMTMSESLFIFWLLLGLLFFAAHK